jgi:hypothetical protein
VFDGHYYILIVSRHIGMASIKKIQKETNNKQSHNSFQRIQNLGRVLEVEILQKTEKKKEIKKGSL